MGKLSGMAVQRVDGVDKPAIRKRFVLVKSEDTAETVEKDYAGAASAVIAAIAKEGVSFSEETVEVLRALVDLLELDVEFAAKSDDEPADETDDESADGDGEGDGEESGEGDESDEDETDDAEGVEKSATKMAYTADEVEAIVAKALAAAGVDVKSIVKDEGSPEGRASALTIKKSKQPQAQDGGEEARTVRKGTGLFSNIVNGDAATPYSG